MNIIIEKCREWIQRIFIRENQIKQFLIIFSGHVFFQTVYAALKLDLFTLLDNKKKLTLAEIAKALNLEIKPTRILLLGLVTVNIVKKKGPYYSNSRIATVTLSRNSNRNLAQYFELQNHVYYRGIPYFYDAIKANRNVGVEAFPGTGDTLYERLGHDVNLKQIFQDAMHEISVSANAHLTNSIDLSNRKFLVDIGGGDGTNLIAFCKKYPHLKAAVFDLPATREIAEKNIAKHGLSDRIQFIAGDCFKDPWPSTADTFLLCHFCTIWSEEKNTLLFQNAHKALPKNGKLIVFNQMQNNSEDGPIVAAIGSPYFLTIATGEGMLYTWNEYQSWMRKAGFETVRAKKLPIYHGAIIGTK